MTDQEICVAAIGGAWPKEALPNRITAWKMDGLYYEICTVQPGPEAHAFHVWIDAEHAAALFRDSGHRWLQANDCDLSINDCTAEGGAVRIKAYTKVGVRHGVFDGDTMLAAINEAVLDIRATHKGESSAE